MMVGPKALAPPLPCRVWFDAPAEGAWNMAVDEALGEAAAESGIATLRFYGWSQPTLSFGYFQNYDERRAHPASANCAVVRRASGGGAILHDRELTYSLALPCPERAIGDAPELYLAVHGALVATLAEWAIAGTVRPAASPTAIMKPKFEISNLKSQISNPQSPPFLCFQRHALGDVLIGGTKIGGSAQRRRRGAVLQHGSVLLERSALAPELAGIRDLTGVGVSPSDLARRWVERLTKGLGFEAHPCELSPAESARAEQLAGEKYGQDIWTHRR